MIYLHNEATREPKEVEASAIRAIPSTIVASPGIRPLGHTQMEHTRHSWGGWKEFQFCAPTRLELVGRGNLPADDV